MKTLELLEKLSEEATPWPWCNECAEGYNEDEGVAVVTATGPRYSYLIDDEWDSESEPKPESILSQKEAIQKARADQNLIEAMRNNIDALIAVARAAQEILPFIPEGDMFGPGKYSEHNVRARNLRDCLEKLK